MDATHELAAREIRSRYGVVWLVTTLGAWVLGLVCYAALLGVGSVASIAVAEILHHASLAAPLLGWARACRSVQYPPEDGCRGTWKLSAPRPIWSLAFVGFYAAATLFCIAAGLLGILLVIPIRVAFTLGWLVWCLHAHTSCEVSFVPRGPEPHPSRRSLRGKGCGSGGGTSPAEGEAWTRLTSLPRNASGLAMPSCCLR